MSLCAQHAVLGPYQASVIPCEVVIFTASSSALSFSIVGYVTLRSFFQSAVLFFLIASYLTASEVEILASVLITSLRDCASSLFIGMWTLLHIMTRQRLLVGVRFSTPVIFW